MNSNRLKRFFRFVCRTNDGARRAARVERAMQKQGVMAWAQAFGTCHHPRHCWGMWDNWQMR